MRRKAGQFGWWVGWPASVLGHRLMRLHRDERGTATLEFALVVPVLLVVVLVLIQTVMIYRGRLVVEYAAFAAARKAIVTIPTRNDAEGFNELLGADSPKVTAVHRSAAWALISVAGPGSAAGVSGDQGGSLSQAIEAFLKASGDVRGAGWSERADGAMQYALRHTGVSIARPVVTNSDAVAFETVARIPGVGAGDPPAGFTFAPRDSVTVVVSHDYCLNVPFAGRLLAAARLSTASGEYAGGNLGDGVLPDGTPYTTLTAQYTMTLEGVIDALPTPPWPTDANGQGVRRIPP